MKYPAFLERGTFFEEGMNPSRMIPMKEAAARMVLKGIMGVLLPIFLLIIDRLS